MKLPFRNLGITSNTRAFQRLVVGIRAEDPARRWERRVPLTPDHVRKLVQRGDCDILVQPSPKRCWSNREYQSAGAEITSDLSSADLILGIKEIPPSEILARHEGDPDRTYAFFSHTHKGQEYNLPLLKSMLDSGCRFLDYELLMEEGRRTVSFGWIAGAVGMVEALGCSGLGLKALMHGISSPFLNLPRPYVDGSLSAVKDSLRRLGEQITSGGTPPELGPVTVVVSGKGRVSSGAMDMLNQLPVEWIPPADLPKVVSDTRPNLGQIYCAQLELPDYLVHEEGAAFDRSEYNSHPSSFTSAFHEKIAPYATVFLNGAFWQKGFPPIISRAQLKEFRQSCGARNRLLTIADVACDFEGGIEFVTRPTAIEQPVLYVGEDGYEVKYSADPKSTQVISIEILPSELPRDASYLFAESLFPYVEAYIDRLNGRECNPEKIRAVEEATIAQNGVLAEPHCWLGDLVQGPHSQPGRRGKRRRVSILGSGMVAGPAIQALLGRTDVSLLIATDTPSEARRLVPPYSDVDVVYLNAADGQQLSDLVKSSEVVVSLLPAALHPQVAELCVDHGVHLVTASYISAEMRSLHERATQANVILLNELGLDPGCDHMSAAKMIASAQRAGQRITSFESWCGGLPAPESSSVPLAYKFSWSPKGVLTAARNTALYRWEGKDRTIPGDDLLAKHFSDVQITPGFSCEGLANRNSLSYLGTYRLDSGLPTILRGTLRYKGFAELMDAFRAVGFLDPEPLKDRPSGWDQLFDCVLASVHGVTVRDAGSRLSALRDVLASANCQASSDAVVDALEWLSLLPDSDGPDAGSTPAFRTDARSPLDMTSNMLRHKLRYLPGERDLVVMQHRLGIESEQCTTSSSPETVHVSSLVVYGEPHPPEGSTRPWNSAMAKTVGLPVALGAGLILDGGISERGVISPTSPEIYDALLPILSQHGITFSEEWRRTGLHAIRHP